MVKEKLETHTELMLEPKSEYVEEMNEDSIEDLTLDDDDLSNMEQQMDDGAGPSHGGEGTSQQGKHPVQTALIKPRKVSPTLSDLRFLKHPLMKPTKSEPNQRWFLVLFADLDGFYYRVSGGVDIASLVAKLRGNFRSRRRGYSDEAIYHALDSILNCGVSVSRASQNFGIKRTSLQFYLKKLNINMRGTW